VVIIVVVMLPGKVPHRQLQRATVPGLPPREEVLRNGVLHLDGLNLNAVSGLINASSPEPGQPRLVCSLVWAIELYILGFVLCFGVSVMQSSLGVETTVHCRLPRMVKRPLCGAGSAGSSYLARVVPWILNQ